MSWFKAEEPEDCNTVPEEVSHEALPNDICEKVGFVIAEKLVVTIRPIKILL